jgi:hypothetical protein
MTWHARASTFLAQAITTFPDCSECTRGANYSLDTNCLVSGRTYRLRPEFAAPSSYLRPQRTPQRKSKAAHGDCTRAHRTFKGTRTFRQSRMNA